MSQTYILYPLAELNLMDIIFNKLCILQIFSKLVVTKLLIRYLRMHNLYAIFVKFLDICKQFADDLVDTRGNIPRAHIIWESNQ